MKPSDIKNDFVNGDRVEFDVEGAGKPFVGQGQITFVDGKGGFRMTPNAPMQAGLKITNIRKVGAK